jgi:hypothetical protein
MAPTAKRELGRPAVTPPARRTDHVPLTARERRLLLASVGAISWRWVICDAHADARRRRLPTCWRPNSRAGHAFVAPRGGTAWSLLLAPFAAAGRSPFFAAQLLAAIVGGLSSGPWPPPRRLRSAACPRRCWWRSPLARARGWRRRADGPHLLVVAMATPRWCARRSWRCCCSHRCPRRCRCRAR